MTDSSWHDDEAPAGDTVELAASPAGRTRRTRIVVAVAAAVAVLAVAGIALAVNGGGKGSVAEGSPAQVLAAAVHKADVMTSATAMYSEHVTGPGAPGISASGTVTEIRKPLQMSMHVTETVGGQVLPLSAIVTGESVYIKFGAVSGIPSGTIGKWFEIKYSEIPGGNAIGSMLQSISAENPSLQLQPLLAGRQVRAVGTAVIAGVRTTEYQGSLTESAVVKALPASVRAQLGPELKDLTGVAHFTAWIDSQDQVRRFTEQETVGAESVNVAITFLSYNQPVTIPIPPPSQVVPLPSSALSGA
jgi:hypothetical protein